MNETFLSLPSPALTLKYPRRPIGVSPISLIKIYFVTKLIIGYVGKNIVGTTYWLQ